MLITTKLRQLKYTGLSLMFQLLSSHLQGFC